MCDDVTRFSTVRARVEVWGKRYYYEVVHLILLSFSQITDEHYAGCGMRLRLLVGPGAVLVMCVCRVLVHSNRPVRVARFAFVRSWLCELWPFL